MLPLLRLFGIYNSMDSAKISPQEYVLLKIMCFMKETFENKDISYDLRDSNILYQPIHYLMI